MKLDRLRKQIDALDARLVELLNERARVAVQIGKVKQSTGGEVYVPSRERDVLRRVAAHNKGPLGAEALEAVYREIMSGSRVLQHPLIIAYLGPEATFTHQAARRRFGRATEYLACETIGDVFDAVEKRSAAYGVVPIENSMDGAVTSTLDELADTPLQICAELELPVAHHLMARGSRTGLRRVYSKAEVFGQCRRWLHANLPGVELVPVSSTARGAMMAAREPRTAALASRLAAEIYGLKLLAEDVQDSSGNTTRFLVLGERSGAPTGCDKTSILFSVRHRAGALYAALEAFQKHRLNMTKIESRPSKTQAWEYYFFVDFEGHADSPHVQRALEQLRKHCTRLTILGAYPRAEAAGAAAAGGSPSRAKRASRKTKEPRS